MIKVVIIDREKHVQDRISSILSAHKDFEVLGLGKDAYDALKLIGNLKPDVAILDNHLEYIEVQEIPPLLRARSPSTAVVILATKTSDTQLYKAAANDVAALLHKESDMHLLPWALKSIAAGGRFISTSFTERAMHLLAIANRGVSGECAKPLANTPLNGVTEKLLPTKDPTEYLSKTELKILACVGEGKNSKEISKSLTLAVGTVRNYISSVMKKTGCNNRSQLVRYALEYGVVPLSWD